MANQHALDADVVIVGCGPVGAMAALRCAQRGLSVIVIERETQVYPLPRAIGMDDEVQDLFGRAGLLRQLHQHSTPMLGGDFVDASGSRVVGVDLAVGFVGALGHPPMIAFDQPSLERFLRSAAERAGVELRLGSEVVALADQRDGVVTTLQDASTVTSRWLIACDGAKSTVRDLVEIDLVDQQFDQTWLVVDTTLIDHDLVLPAIPRQHCNPDRVVTFVPGHGTRRRWEFQLQPDETRDQALRPTFIDALLKPWGRPDQLTVDRAAVYRFHATVAERFREGSVFLAGDAAHQMPPFNGQGMCSGMRDAENLAWKLAAVAHQGCTDSLLGSYDIERRPHATSQVAHSVDAGKLIEAISNDGERALESGYGRRKFPKIAHGIIDGDHRLVGMPLPRPADDSFTIGDGFTLLRGAHAGDDDIAPTWHALGAAVHQLTPAAYGETFAADTTVIVRPDRFIAAITRDLAATTAKFDQMLSG